MNPRQLKRIAIALLVALILWGAAEILGGGRDNAETMAILPALESTDVDTVMMLSPTDTVLLTRTGADWTVNGFEASEQEIENLFSGLAEESESELVSTGESVHGRMEVDDAGTRLRLVDGATTLADLIFGKSGRRYNSRYVRVEGSNSVYLYVGEVSRFIGRKVDDWRNKRIIDLVPDSIQMVAVRRDGERYTLVRTEGAWQLSDGAAADSGAVARMLSQYAALDASGFATESQADSADFARPERTVIIVGQPGDTLARLAFDSTASAYWVKSGAKETIYRILQWKANQMVVAESTLVAKEGS